MLNYPLRFQPILQEKLWGGDKLVNLFSKQSNSRNIGESWEISGVEGFISIVSNGSLAGNSLNDLISKYKNQLVGSKVYKAYGKDFPLLIKFIDAKIPLSIQVHPNDEMAKHRHDSFGKTEMWYIMQADEDAKLNIGFTDSLGKEAYLESLNAGKLTDILHFEKVSSGDSVFLNAGKVHAIGGGIVLAEIQQTSDITYRIYDWDRVDDNGNPRELHTELALDAIDFEKKDDYKLNYSKKNNTSNTIANCPYFTTNFLPVKGHLEKDYTEIDSFIIYMCVSGSATLATNGHSENLDTGETLLIPAIQNRVNIDSVGCELLEVYIGA